MRRRSITATLAALTALLLLLPLTVALSQTANFGTGWSASYWNNTNLEGAPVYTENLAGGINFDWQLGSPNPAVNNDNWSARFQSIQLFNQGTYEFVVTSDDGVRVYIDNVLVLDRWIGRTLTTDRFQQTLVAGTHALTVEYFEGIDRAALQFQWFQISGVATNIPPGIGGTFIFGTPIPATPAGPQAVVTGVRGLALRTGPYVGASFITTLRQDTSHTVLGRNRDEGIYNWYLLQVGDRQGWASGRYLTLEGVTVEAIPVVGSKFDQIISTAGVSASATTRAVMNIRRRPSERTQQLGSIPWGATVPLIGRTVQAGQNRWLLVQYEGITGWIDARWVTVRGELNQIPIY